METREQEMVAELAKGNQTWARREWKSKLAKQEEKKKETKLVSAIGIEQRAFKSTIG